MPSHRVSPKGDPVTHYWLVQAMATATGVDLARASRDGALSHGAWAGMVETCRACDWQRDGACTRWLALTEPATADAPDTCANKATFDELSEAAE